MGTCYNSCKLFIGMSPIEASARKRRITSMILMGMTLLSRAGKLSSHDVHKAS
ncbi:hypothetical protein NC653_018189 [Populus alba x Populus x berolinensis]|uniref:Uncharacterized protein n=1 Tax=Populus alba x Populus x berolinensis TaxID=444605 RepID=A0AAD6QFW6_9ROSI|nr:hypothetical protein NC653_018189 [Populus alba x Populus x berolinensis]